MEHELIIGKYTLESLTNGMYSSPLDLYREYIQNSVDSFDNAIKENLENKDALNIQISLNFENKSITIFDNGCGIPISNAVASLIDIGNSSKHRSLNRGFRGIGRLAGLGYCDRLIFTTSSKGEREKTIVDFDARLLKGLLLERNSLNVGVKDVINRIVSTSIEPEKIDNHYFEVKLIGVTEEDGLLDESMVSEYLIQHAPLPYANEFKWQNPILEKTRIAGYKIPSYRICLNGVELYKPYKDEFISDRVKKITDSIQDICVKSFYRDGELSAILWYGETSFYGTINDNSVKGIRIRQGNILIGDKSSCNSLFKEERFNGWLLGELHIIDPELIVNSRRDDFEKNSAYYTLVNSFREWALSQSKVIRHISYERSLSKEKKALVEAESFDDVNDLYSEDMGFAEDISESDLLNSSESDIVAEVDYIGRLTAFLGKKNNQTKYTALNINSKLTIEQRKVLERVFDLIQQEYEAESAEKFINTIARKF